MNYCQSNSFVCSFTGLSGLTLLTANPILDGCVLFDPSVYADPILIYSMLKKVSRSNWGEIGVRLCLDTPDLLVTLFEDSSVFRPDFLVLASMTGVPAQLVEEAHLFNDRVFYEVYSVEDAVQAIAGKCDGLVIRGNESGGLCGIESNFSLIRKIVPGCKVPVWVTGGMGPESGTAAKVAGIAKIILSDSLLLQGKTNPFLPTEKAILSTAPKSTSCGLPHFIQYRTNSRNVSGLADQREKIMHSQSDVETQHQQWYKTLKATASRLVSGLPPLGEESLWVEQYGRQTRSLSHLLSRLNTRLADNLKAIHTTYPLRAENPLALDYNLEFPIFQGPMAHVSDQPEFLAAVAGQGALPFAALALHQGDRLEKILQQTSELLADQAWGVGILGFAPRTILDHQLALLEKYPPSAVIVAGGRASQYDYFAKRDIPAYLHVPSPALIRDFFKAGVRRFIFEGRGSGGHIGPINSFSLWQAAVYEFQEIARETDNGLEDVHIILAGGISDTLSAHMAASFAPPLEELGVHFGVIMGTAYLTCDEAVSSGAIVEEYRQMALSCQQTVVLESGDGHAIRCAASTYADVFSQRKSELHAEGLEPTAIRLSLDEDNIGRLRIASRGITRQTGKDGFISLSEEEQRQQGCYMMGETVGLIQTPTTIQELHQAISKPLSRQEEQPAAEACGGESDQQYARTDIAVIGMACLVPGAHDLDTLWHNILAEISFIKLVPEKRWKHAINFDPDPQTPDKIYSQHGAFLDPVYINSGQYGIPPTTVPSIEPAQLLALEAVSRAIADAGYGDTDFDREQASVFFGTSGGGGDLALGYSVRAALNEYLGRAAEIPDDSREKIMAALADVLPEWTEDSFPGILSNVIAGRISNRFDLKGLNFTVDAACASSLAAVRVACQELVYGDTNLAIVGGVDTTQHPFGYTCFSKTHALSRMGKSRPFHEDADGIILGEGVGVTILKRMNDAVRDGDRIYAVIKGVGGSSDGKGRSMTAPAPEGQVLAVERAYAIAGYSPATLSLVEAHGTGTALGDRTELTSIQTVLNKYAARPVSCAVGSIKSAIGHTKAAAGINGLIKACLALHHKILPSTLNAEKVSLETVPAQSPLYVNTSNRPWISDQHPRRAGVNSFGFGGTNFHVALEESPIYNASKQQIPSELWPGELFCLSATSTKELIANMETLCLSEANQSISLPLLSLRHHEMQHHKPWSAPKRFRLAFVATNHQQLQDNFAILKHHIAINPKKPLPRGMWLHKQTESNPVPKLAFLFSGQGSQRRQMGSQLARFFPVVRETLDASKAILSEVSDLQFFRELFPPSVNVEPLVATEIVQPVLAITEMGLYKLLAEFGLTADCCGGHSFGELTALWAAGALCDTSLLHLAVARGQLMASASGISSGMTAVRASAEELVTLTEGIEELYPANFNSPVQAVVSGTIQALSHFETRCTEHDVRYKRLAVSHGFHSPFMSEAAVKWAELLQLQKFNQPLIPIYSNQTANPYPADPKDISSLLTSHLQSPVQFIDQIHNMYGAGARTFVEVGPGRVLTGLSDIILGETPHRSISLMNSVDHELQDFIHAIGQLWVFGHAVDISPLFRIRHLPEPVIVPQPSATLFKVDGGQSVPTLPLKAKLKKAPKEPLRFTTQDPALAPVSPQAVPAQGSQPVSPSVTVDKLQMISQFQDSMTSFVDQQEKLQLERREMMQRMWSMQETMYQSLVGSPGQPAVVSPAMPVMEPASPVEPVVQRPEESHRPEPQKSVTPAPRQDVNSLLFEVITERTGYPVEMLAGDQHLEADLGIDSIKRMEILTALKDAQPALADIANERYFEEAAQLRTIADIGNWIEETFLSGTSALTSAPAQNEQTAPVVDISALLFEVITERTGYPTEMLAGDQHLEADLGIDSIKRMEILTALKDAQPALADIANEKYFEEAAQLRTIADICNWIEETFLSGTSALTSAPVQNEQMAPVVDISALLFEVITERTGYPTEMLAGDQHLEADLGIDSIKRMEILTALKDAQPALADIANEKYFEEAAQLRTIADICNWIEQTFLSKINQPQARQSSRSQQVTGSVPQQVQVQPSAPIRRYRLKVAEAPALQLRSSRNFSGSIVILAGTHPLGAYLHGQWQKEGLPSVLISQDENCNYTSQQDVTACITRHITGNIAVVVNLLALDCEKDAQNGRATILNSFRCAKALAPNFKNNTDGMWLSVTTMGGDFGLSNRADFDPLQNGSHGIAKTIGHEWPGVRVKCLDLKPDYAIDQQIKIITDEILTTDSLAEVGWDGINRGQVQLYSSPLLLSVAKPSFTKDSVFLLTGGGRGITASAAIRLAKQYGPVLILTGRSVLPERSEAELVTLQSQVQLLKHDSVALKQKIIAEIKDRGEVPGPALVNRAIRNLDNEYHLRRNISMMEEMGATVHYHSIDCTDQERFSALIKTIYGDHHRIDGVIHGAGIIRDSLLVNKEEENFNQVIATKVTGAEILVQELHPADLQFLIFFSSISGRFGNKGQADYAAANEVLNKLAVKLDASWSARVTAINWGPWESEGMVDDTVRQQFAQLGISLISTQTGIDMLMDEITTVEEPGGEVVIFGSNELSDMMVKNTPVLPLAALASTEKTADGGRIFRFSLDPARHVYLADHCIDGKPVLPAAMALELMAEAAVVGGQRCTFTGIRDFKLLKGIILPEQLLQIEIVVTLLADDGNNSCEYEVVLKSSDIPAGMVNFSCIVTLKKSIPFQPAEPDYLEALEAYPLAMATLYKTKLFHQGMFQRLITIKGLSTDTAGKAGIAGIIEPSSPQTALAADGEWLVDPLCFDCAYQLSLLWSQEFNETMPLPGNIASYQCFKPYDGQLVYCEVLVQQCTPPLLHLDFIFKDEGNNVYAKAEGVEVIMSRELNQRVLASLDGKNGV